MDVKFKANEEEQVIVPPYSFRLVVLKKVLYVMERGLDEEKASL